MNRMIIPRRGVPDGFSWKQVPEAFTSLPRVVRLVWDTSKLLTLLMGILSILQGFTPAISLWITNLVINGVVTGIRTHSTGPIWLPISLQVGIGVFSSLLSTLSNITQQLLQEK